MVAPITCSRQVVIHVLLCLMHDWNPHLLQAQMRNTEQATGAQMPADYAGNKLPGNGALRMLGPVSCTISSVTMLQVLAAQVAGTVLAAVLALTA